MTEGVLSCVQSDTPPSWTRTPSSVHPSHSRAMWLGSHAHPASPWCAIQNRPALTCGFLLCPLLPTLHPWGEPTEADQSPPGDGWVHCTGVGGPGWWGLGKGLLDRWAPRPLKSDPLVT